MRVRMVFFGLIMAVLIAFSACETDVVTINVFNWGSFIDPEVLDIFTQETGIRVIYNTYATNEEMYYRIRDGRESFDVLFPSDYMIYRMIAEGMLAPLNWDNIPNAEYIFDQFWYLDFDPGNRYSVPYMWGTFGILYNTTMVDIPVESWEILWDTQFEGEIFMYASSRDTFGAVLRMLGYSVNTTSLGELNAARDKLIMQMPLVRAYLGDPIMHSMIGREGALATVFSGDAFFCMNENPELNYVIPQEGSFMFFDSMVIPVTSTHKAEAEAFINFMTRPDIALMNTMYIGYSTTNRGAFYMLPYEWQNHPVYWPGYEYLEGLEILQDVGEFRQEFHRAWTEVMVAGG